MRYIGKLLLATAMACALAGVLAASASAAVEVANDDPIHVSGDPGLIMTTVYHPFPNQVVFYCALDMTAESNSDGQVYLSDIEFSTPTAGGSESCNWADDCGGNGWEGQIVGPGDDGYTGLGDFELLVNLCTTEHGAGSIRFAIDEPSSPEGLEQWSIPTQPADPQGDYQWEGALGASDNLGIESVED